MIEEKKGRVVVLRTKSERKMEGKTQQTEHRKESIVLINQKARLAD